MKVTIIQSDGVVGVNGAFRTVDLADLDPAIHVIQFDTDKGKGHIEFDAGLDPRRENKALTELGGFSVYVDRWTAAAPPAPTAEELKAVEIGATRAEALKALDDARLAEAVLDPLAPQAVKDYAALLKK